MSDTKLQIQEVERLPNGINTKRTIPWHTFSNYRKAKYADEILK
jgi:hypothetical protein